MNGKSEKLANFEKLVNENKGKTMYQLIDERREELKKEKFPFKLGSEGWYIDYDKRKGEFKSNGGGSKVEFPINMYICYMDEFEAGKVITPLKFMPG